MIVHQGVKVDQVAGACTAHEQATFRGKKSLNAEDAEALRWLVSHCGCVFVRHTRICRDGTHLRDETLKYTEADFNPADSPILHPVVQINRAVAQSALNNISYCFY